MKVFKSPFQAAFLLIMLAILGSFGYMYAYGIERPTVLSPLFSLSLAAMAGWALTQVRNKALFITANKKKKQAVITFCINLVFGFSLFILLIPVLHEFGVPTTSLVTILGTSTLAIGLALKDFLGNIAAGIMLILQRPFEIGDWVELSGKLGMVERIDLFSVKMKTAENEVVYFPNGKLITDKIINKTALGKRRLECLIDVSYDSDLKLAKQILLELVKADSRVLQEPAPLVAVHNLGNHGVELTVRVWVKSSDMLYVKFDLLEQVKLTFDEKGIIIPFPQMNVALTQTK